MHVETHNPGAVPQRNGATSPIRPLAILGRPLMVLLLLAPALAANPPAYHRRALVELDNLDLGNGHSRAQAASLFAEESGEPLPACEQRHVLQLPPPTAAPSHPPALMVEDNLPAYLGRAQAEPGNPALDERHRQPQPANLPTEASEEPPPESAQWRQLPPPILNATPRTAVPATNMEPAEEEAKDYEQNERRGTDYLPPPLEVPREPGRPATRTRRQPPSPPLPPPSSDPAPNA